MKMLISTLSPTRRHKPVIVKLEETFVVPAVTAGMYAVQAVTLGTEDRKDDIAAVMPPQSAAFIAVRALVASVA